MAYSTLGALIYIYSVFSPYRIADYISKSLPSELNYVQLAVVFALAAALLVGKRKTLNLLLIAFGAFEGYVLSAAISSRFPMSQQTDILVMLALTVTIAYIVFKLSRPAISAFLALTVGATYIALAGPIYTAPYITVAAFVIIFIFYKHIASVIAALLGSILLLLFLIELNLPGVTPYVITIAAFAMSVLIRHFVSRMGAAKFPWTKRARATRLRN